MLPITKTQITFESGSKPIRVDCFLPSGNGERFPAVISLHGSGGGVAGTSAHASMLAAQGFAVYVLHYFDRTGTTFADKETIFRHFPIWVKTVWDAVSHVERQPQVHPQRIALLGFSLGAYLSLSDAAVDSRVRAVVEFFGGLPREMRFFMRRLCPVLILHGDADPTVPVEEAYHLQKILEKRNIPYEMQIYPCAGHGFDEETWRDASLRTLAFLQKYLVA
jgi:carboxymethylenebutenolidase